MVSPNAHIVRCNKIKALLTTVALALDTTEFAAENVICETLRFRSAHFPGETYHLGTNVEQDVKSSVQDRSEAPARARIASPRVPRACKSNKKAWAAKAKSTKNTKEAPPKKDSIASPPASARDMIFVGQSLYQLESLLEGSNNFSCVGGGGIGYDGRSLPNENGDVCGDFRDAEEDTEEYAPERSTACAVFEYKPDGTKRIVPQMTFGGEFGDAVGAESTSFISMCLQELNVATWILNGVKGWRNVMSGR